MPSRPAQRWTEPASHARGDHGARAAATRLQERRRPAGAARRRSNRRRRRARAPSRDGCPTPSPARPATRDRRVSVGSPAAKHEISAPRRPRAGRHRGLPCETGNGAEPHQRRVGHCQLVGGGRQGDRRPCAKTTRPERMSIASADVRQRFSPGPLSARARRAPSGELATEARTARGSRGCGGRRERQSAQSKQDERSVDAGPVERDRDGATAPGRACARRREPQVDDRALHGRPTSAATAGP